MSKTNLPTKFFRARLFDGNKPVFVWDFNLFHCLNDFYKSVHHAEKKTSEARIDFFLCFASDTKEILLDSFHVDIHAYELLNYDHPKRIEKSGALEARPFFIKPEVDD